MSDPLPSRRRKLPARYGAILMPFLLTLFMTCLISGISTMISMGFSIHALGLWPKAWALSWLVAFPTILVVLPVVRRIVAALVEEPGQ